MTGSRSVQRCACVFGACALLAMPSAASASNPWQLRCAAMPVERASPFPLDRAARRFFPWVPSAGKGLHAGPVYLVALSTRSAISRDGDYRDGDGYYLHRALLAV